MSRSARCTSAGRRASSRTSSRPSPGRRGPELTARLGTGSDVRRGWMLALSLACAALVGTAVGARLTTADGPHARAARLGGLTVMASGAVALALWLPGGPLGRDWARRAGTPAKLLRPPAAEAAAPTP